MTAASGPPRTWYFLSDLHLGDAPDRRGRQHALVAFLGALASRPGHDPRVRCTLVLLGDTVDLSGRRRLTDAGVVGRLESLIERHAEVVAALRRCLRAGIEVQVVLGNHDLELGRPAVRRSLERSLGAADGTDDATGGSLRVSPWVLHEPGVFYAEHGNQHYELNRVPALLTIDAVPDATSLPVTPTGALSSASEWCAARGSTVGGVLRSLYALAHQERAARAPAYVAALARHAVALGLPREVVRELASLTTFRLRTALLGVVLRRLGRGGGAGLLQDRALDVHEVLARAGCPVPVYVFGHNHRAETVDLLVRPPATYLNCGTWSEDVRGSGPDVGRTGLFPYVEVRQDEHGVSRHLRYWGSDAAAPAAPAAPAAAVAAAGDGVAPGSPLGRSRSRTGGRSCATSGGRTFEPRSSASEDPRTDQHDSREWAP